MLTAASEGRGRRCALPFHHQAERLVGAFHQADCLLSVATQGNIVDVDKFISHLETHRCCLATLLNLKHKQNNTFNTPQRPTSELYRLSLDLDLLFTI